ncbi:MAG: hypothetical protein GKR91_03445 [Pseudomonadales bacterium]|nr:hypothetical protein [Pseudomonadales bacterium]
MSLVARHLEANGIPTLIIGSARDIVEHCGVPRFLYTDFPLGNPCGKPYDHDMQLSIISQAIALLRTATTANTTEKAPYIWSADNSWRDDYAKVDDSNREELARRGEERRRRQTEDKAEGIDRVAMIADG